MRALGAVAAGHDDYAAQLSALAEERGVDFEVTGYVPDSELAAALDAITVPVCPHRHVSASGSLNTWIAHNRRVVVADGPYMREVAERWPDRVVCSPVRELPSRLLRSGMTTREAPRVRVLRISVP